MSQLPNLILLLLLACGGGSSGNNAAVMETELGIQAIVDNQALSCAPLNGENCPEGVGRVFVQSENNPEEFILCTGFLIRPNRMVTNGHCLSRAVDCARTFVVFPRLGRGSVSAECTSLVQTFYDEDNFPQSRDITVFDLDQSLDLKLIQIATERARRGETYSVWAMDHLNILEARLTEYECIFEGDGFTEEYSRCPAIQGNSGSPILDSREEAVSILWGSSLNRSVDARLDLRARREVEAFSFAYDLQILRRLSLE